ncbi:MAG: flagellar hook-associated protein FlgL [Polyangiaceae bacterium]|nr:flagellar hook-associated protein FlgL [Polyangiaceae bacterium]
MRITDGARQAIVESSLARVRSDHARALETASTGARVLRASDDPVAAAELARSSARAARLESHQVTARTVRGDVELAESSLAQATDVLVRAREIATQAANGSYSAEDRQRMADEVGALREHLRSVANVRGSKGYLFAGSLTTTAPVDGTGAFVGDDTLARVDVAPGTTVTVGQSGRGAFARAGGRDVFADLAALEASLSTDDQAGVAASLDVLEQGERQLVDARAGAGLTLERLDVAETIGAEAGVALSAHVERVGAAPLPEAFSRLVSLESAFEQAVSVARRTLELSLF